MLHWSDTARCSIRRNYLPTPHQYPIRSILKPLLISNLKNTSLCWRRLGVAWDVPSLYSFPLLYIYKAAANRSMFGPLYCAPSPQLPSPLAHVSRCSYFVNLVLIIISCLIYHFGCLTGRATLTTLCMPSQVGGGCLQWEPFCCSVH